MAFEKKSKTATKEYDNTNRGALYDNSESKAQNDKRPDWTGFVKLAPGDYDVGKDGLIEVRLSAWLSDDGSRLGLKASPSSK